MNYRSKTTAMVLCFFLGMVGAHWFYLGRPKWGGTYLCVFVGGWPAAIQLVLLGSALHAELLGGFLVLAVWAAEILLVLVVLYDFLALLMIEPVRFDRIYNQTGEQANG